MKLRNCKVSYFIVLATVVGITNVLIVPRLSGLSRNPSCFDKETTPSSALSSDRGTFDCHPSTSNKNDTTIRRSSTKNRHSYSATATTTTKASNNLQNVTLFYNIFLPNLNHALKIVEEQLLLVQQSYVATQNTVIYFNTMGEKANEGWKLVQDLCHDKTTTTSIRCIPLTHQTQGDEIATLDAMYKFCIEYSEEKDNIHDNNTHTGPILRVGYLHNKGSFHDTPENAKLRIPFTKAVTSQDCWNPPNQSCTSCGLVFLDLPFMTMPGNFFVCRCDYIRKLIPPLQFEAAQQRLLASAKVLFPSTFATNTTTMTTVDSDNNNANDATATTTTTKINSFQNRDSWIGIGRYASEHWAHSHPDVVPCDLSQRLKVWFRPNPNQPMKFQMYPRPALEKFHRNQPKVEFEDYYGIAGQVFKWYFLYGRVAPQESWVWKRMKDGLVWKDAVLKYGRNVTNVMLGRNKTF